MVKCKDMEKSKHHHKGKSSEKLLDKKKIINSFNISEGLTVLDAGCGDGYMAREFAQIVGDAGKVYALDVDNISIEMLQSTVKTEPIEAFVGDISTKTRLNAASIDFIYISTVLHGFTESQMQGFAAEVERLLKPGGILAILEIKKENTSFGPPLSIRLSPEDLKGILPLTPKETINIGEYFYLQLFEK